MKSRRLRIGGAFLAMLAACTALAADPAPGQDAMETIRTREQAVAIVNAAKPQAAAVRQTYTTAAKECNAKILVTRCEEQARALRDRELAEIERKRVAANDFIRKIDAAERAQRRQLEEDRRREEAPARQERADKTRVEREAREQAAPPQAVAPTPRAARAPVTAPDKGKSPARAARMASPPPSLTEAERAEKQRLYDEKQKRAAEYARQKAAEREGHAKSREKRAREQAEAAVRRDAAAKLPPKP